jgi:hypothetical protein
MLKRAIHFLLFSCSETTLLIEMHHADNLPMIQKLRLKGHLSICKWCSAYEKKIIMMDTLLRNNLNKEHNQIIHENDIQDFKSRIKNKIKT